MTAPLINGYEVVIGFETHAQLATASKIFSRTSTAFGAEPNTQASAVCLALPGTLPVMNKKAVECAIQLGLALGSHVAPLLGAQTDPVTSYLADIYTLPAALAGLPGMSVPAGVGAGGMPVGLQLIGNYFQEGRLLNAAHQLQLATDHHLRRPEGI